jgi:hypothetical protein
MCRQIGVRDGLKRPEKKYVDVRVSELRSPQPLDAERATLDALLSNEHARPSTHSEGARSERCWVTFSGQDLELHSTRHALGPKYAAEPHTRSPLRAYLASRLF